MNIFVKLVFFGVLIGASQAVAQIPVTVTQIVNTKVTASSATTLTQAWPSQTGAGHSILCMGQENAAAVPVFTDADSNSFVVVKSGSTAPGYSIAVASNIAGATTDLITMTLSSGSGAFACWELAGTPPFGQIWNVADVQQATGSTITFAPATVLTPGEMLFTAAGFNAGTVNATPALGGNLAGLVTVDAANTAPLGTSANLAVFYAAHTTISAPTAFTQTESLSASETYTALLVSIRPSLTNQNQTDGPAVPCYLTSGASTNATLCKGEPGNVDGIYIINTTTTNYFLRMYNLAAAPTCSSATGFVETIPALGGATNGGGIARAQLPQGYSTGIAFCLTGGGSSTDNTNAATGVYVTILFK